MINYSNIQRYDNLDFEDYLKLDGYSFSFLKREINGVSPVLEMTDNIRLGSLVDSILTEPHKVTMKEGLYTQAKDIAARIKSDFGSMISMFNSQVSFTADVDTEGFLMPVTGRVDFLLQGFAVIDLKVTLSKNIHTLINFMRYEHQVWNYCKMAGVDKAYLMIHSVPLKKTELIYLDCSKWNNDFWEDKITKFGKVAA